MIRLTSATHSSRQAFWPPVELIRGGSCMHLRTNSTSSSSRPSKVSTSARWALDRGTLPSWTTAQASSAGRCSWSSSRTILSAAGPRPRESAASSSGSSPPFSSSLALAALRATETARRDSKSSASIFSSSRISRRGMPSSTLPPSAATSSATSSYMSTASALVNPNCISVTIPSWRLMACSRSRSTRSGSASEMTSSSSSSESSGPSPPPARAPASRPRAGASEVVSEGASWDTTATATLTGAEPSPEA
mmetsp:Transcript_36180/g.104121  ORF Transcript_36180/g.104121 Transcript_36180/m.104121 type:complete len:250 (-) Transcript_36180:136-885(-)